MDELAKKLNYKETMVAVLMQVPPGMETLAASFDKVRLVAEPAKELPALGPVNFALAFIFSGEDLEHSMSLLADKLEGDCVLWMCYPKKSSRRYQATLDRDHGWAILGTYGYEPVRQVALDEDFSALRFRKVVYIKKMIRPESARLTKGDAPQGGADA